MVRRVLLDGAGIYLFFADFTDLMDPPPTIPTLPMARFGALSSAAGKLGGDFSNGSGALNR